MFYATGQYVSAANAAAIISRIAKSAGIGAEQWAIQTLEDAQNLVPVRTGELRDSGHMETAEETTAFTASVVFDAGHSMFVEFGTGLSGSGTYPFPLPQSGVPITGAWIYDYRGIGWKGMEARPYLRPAFDANVDKAEEVIRDTVREVL